MAVTFATHDDLAELEKKIEENGGTPGENGENGITPHIGENGNWFIGDEDTGKPSRGEVGPVGPKGDSVKGDDGKTPVLGVDYWTPDDRAAVTAEAIAVVQANAVQQTPLFANSVDECTDTTKVYVLPDGYIYAHFEGEEAEPQYTNVLPLSIDSDGTVYNKVGYKKASRINSSGNVADVSNTSASNPAFATGFIAAKTGDTFRLENCYIDTDGRTDEINYWGGDKGALRICLYHKTFNYSSIAAWSEFLSWSVVTATADADGRVTEFTIGGNINGYIRLTLGGDPETAIITINEEISSSEATETGWRSTGHAFVPADYENRIVAIENALSGTVFGIIDENQDVLLSGNFARGNYTFKFINSDGTTSTIGTHKIE